MVTTHSTTKDPQMVQAVDLSSAVRVFGGLVRLIASDQLASDKLEQIQPTVRMHGATLNEDHRPTQHPFQHASMSSKKCSR
ncbi:unnamed protein product [Nippostrongylus brasiliensis]|uniref:ABC transporter ATP-binding protein n=1 Tax=Nippostrongylus brasiliensis TaxID=27835 RepID=A0A0N4Y4B3_NIPBR|nr:hypothetical protein Q1695_010242 [Nippostrongylus brasiliensis]VDL74310.1 unnamed protein product [Nippostrongylus brasiliensis]